MLVPAVVFVVVVAAAVVVVANTAGVVAVVALTLFVTLIFDLDSHGTKAQKSALLVSSKI